MLRDVLQQCLGKTVYFFETSFLKFQVNLPVTPHLLDISRHTLARLQRLENLVMIQHSVELVVYDDLVSQVGTLPYQGIHFFACLVFGMFLRQEMFYLGRSHNAVTFLVDIDINNVSAALHHLGFLLAIGNKKVFHQPPIEECTVLIDPSHFQASKLAHLNVRLKGSCHQTFFHIQIDKDIQHIARLAAFGHITLRQ